MSVTRRFSEEELKGNINFFSSLIPFLVRASVTTEDTKAQLHSLRQIICPALGPSHDAPLTDWIDFAKRVFEK